MNHAPVCSSIGRMERAGCCSAEPSVIRWLSLRELEDSDWPTFAYLTSRRQAVIIARLRQVIPDAPPRWIHAIARLEELEDPAALDVSGSVVRGMPWRDHGARFMEMVADDELEHAYLHVVLHGEGGIHAVEAHLTACKETIDGE